MHCINTSFLSFVIPPITPDLSISFTFWLYHSYPMFSIIKYRAQQSPRPTFLIVPTISQPSISALSNHSASHTNYCAPCKVLSYAPTAPVLPPGNPAQSSYIPRSDCELYYCFPLSAPISIPSLSDFGLPYQFSKGLFPLQYYHTAAPWLSSPYPPYPINPFFLSAHFKGTFRAFICPLCLFPA